MEFLSLHPPSEFIPCSGFVDCDPSKPTSTYTGYEVAAFRGIAANAGWLEVPSLDVIALNGTISFYFKCTDLNQPGVINVLTANSSTANSYPDYPCVIAGGMFEFRSLRTVF